MVSLTAWQQALAADTNVPLATKGFLLVATINCDWKTGTGVKPGRWLQDKAGISRSQSYEHLGRALKAGYLAKDGRIYRLCVPLESGIPDTAMKPESPGYRTESPGYRTESPESVRDTGPVSNQSLLTLQSSVSDDMTGEEKKDNQDQELTGQDGPSAAGEAGHDWEDYPSGEALVEDLNEVLAGSWPREDYPDAEPFDARFLRGGAKRLDELVRVMNRYRFDMDDVASGMFLTPHESRGLGLGRADHNLDRVANPARLVGKVMSGPIDQIIAYGERGKKINAATNAQN